MIDLSLSKTKRRFTLVCHDCGTEEGNCHEFGCDMEDCPFCGKQLITCDCCYKLLNIDVSEGTWDYYNGLTENKEVAWKKLLVDKGRIPFVVIPVLCFLCGKKVSHDELHEANMPDEDWDKYIIPELQLEVLCIKCCGRMRKLFPNGWRNAGGYIDGR